MGKFNHFVGIITNKFAPSSKSMFLACFILIMPFDSFANEIPIEHFVKHGDYLDLKLSPDGKHLAGRIRRNNGVSLIVLNVETLEVVGGISAPENRIVHTLTWVNNERIVFEIAEKFIWMGDNPVSTGELYAVNYDGSNAKLLYGFRAGTEETGRRIKGRKDTRAHQEVISILSDDPDHILIAEYPWVKRAFPTVSKLNIHSGAKRKIERIPYNYASILADERNGEIRFVSWYDLDDVLHAATRQNKKADWVELSFDEEFGDSAKPVQISDDGTKVYWRVDLGSKELSSLREMDIASSESRVLFTSNQSDLYSWQNDFVNNEPVVGVFYPGDTEYQYLESNSAIKTAHKQMAKAFAGQDVSIRSYSDDGKLLLVKVTSDVNPGEYYLFNRESKKVDFLWANRSWIDPRQMSTMKNAFADSRDGKNIHYLLTLPQSTSTEKPPLIVIPHGGPHGVRDYWQFDSEVQLLANRGYSVLQINFRGSGGFGDKFVRSGYRQWGEKMIEDIIDVTKAVIDTEQVDGDKVCIYGASYGGYAAMMSAAKAPALFKCTVGYVGVYDLNIMYSDGDIPYFWGGEEYLEKVIGRDKAVLAKNSPVTVAADITSDIMLIHGMEDRRTPIKHAHNMREALKEAGKKFEWLTFAGGGHGIYDEAQRLELYTKLLEFLDNSLAVD